MVQTYLGRREEECKGFSITTNYCCLQHFGRKKQERDNDIVFSEEGNIYEDSMLDNVDLENYNNFNHPHIDIGDRWEKL